MLPAEIASELRARLDDVYLCLESGRRHKDRPDGHPFAPEDVARWQEATGWTRDQLYKFIALHAARAFASGEYHWEDAMLVVQNLWDLGITVYGGAAGEPVWSIYNALDRGEYVLPSEGDIDPVELHVRPWINEILSSPPADTPFSCFVRDAKP